MNNAARSARYTETLTNGTETIHFVVDGSVCLWSSDDYSDACSAADAKLTIARLLDAGWAVTCFLAVAA